MHYIYAMYVMYCGSLPGEWFHYSKNDIENLHLLSYAKSMLFMDFI